MDTQLTPAELDALLEAARAATGDEWRAVSYIGRQARHVVTGRFTEQSTIASIENPNGLVAYADVPNNATFIARANPATITRLVLMVRELQQERDNWKEFAEECKEGIRASHRLLDEFNVPREDAWLQETDGESYGIEEVVEYPVHERIKMLPPLAVEHFRTRAAKACRSRYPTMNAETFALLIESLPLVETEEE